MTDQDGTNKIEGRTVRGAQLDTIVLWHGTSLPTAPTNEVPAGGLFLLEGTGEIYENTNTEASPTWTLRVGSASTSNVIVCKYSSTIGDFDTPTEGAASSGASGTITNNNTSGRFSMYSGSREVFGQELKAGSALESLEVNEFSVYVAKNGSPTGTATIGVYDATTAAQLHSFGTFDVATLTTSLVKTTASTGSYTLSVGEVIGISYTGGNGSNYLEVSVDTGDPYDSTNTDASSYNGSTWTDNVGTDLEFELKYDDPSNLYDDNTGTAVTTSSEANPWARVGVGSLKILCELALHLDRTSTTETEITIQTSADDNTTPTTWVTQRTITVSNITDDTWMFYRFPCVNARHVRVYGNSGSTVVLKINEMKILDRTTTELLTQMVGAIGGHEHLSISSSDTSLNDDGTE